MSIAKQSLGTRKTPRRGHIRRPWALADPSEAMEVPVKFDTLFQGHTLHIPVSTLESLLAGIATRSGDEFHLR